jgi:prevent-host-death family protein
MRVSVSDAKAQLTELVRRAEQGEEIELTRHGQPVVRLAPILKTSSVEARREALRSARDAARKALAGPSAARSQDFLYGENGLPG